VTADQQLALVKGRLALVRQDANYELIPPEIAEKVRVRDASLVMVMNQGGEGGDSSAEEENDPYAEYKVPDDLMW
jgi:hypothetical protein